MVWQSIETVPRDGTRVLLFTRDGIIEAYFQKCAHCDDWWHDWHFSVVDSHESIDLRSAPTHWAALPDPPM